MKSHIRHLWLFFIILPTITHTVDSQKVMIHLANSSSSAFLKATTSWCCCRWWWWWTLIILSGICHSRCIIISRHSFGYFNNSFTVNSQEWWYVSFAILFAKAQPRYSNPRGFTEFRSCNLQYSFKGTSADTQCHLFARGGGGGGGVQETTSALHLIPDSWLLRWTHNRTIHGKRIHCYFLRSCLFLGYLWRLYSLYIKLYT